MRIGSIIVFLLGWFLLFTTQSGETCAKGVAVPVLGALAIYLMPMCGRNPAMKAACTAVTLGALAGFGYYMYTLIEPSLQADATAKAQHQPDYDRRMIQLIGGGLVALVGIFGVRSPDSRMLPLFVPMIGLASPVSRAARSRTSPPLKPTPISTKRAYRLSRLSRRMDQWECRIPSSPPRPVPVPDFFFFSCSPTSPLRAKISTPSQKS